MADLAKPSIYRLRRRLDGLRWASPVRALSSGVLRARTSPRAATLGVVGVATLVAVGWAALRATPDSALTAAVTRGTLHVRLVEAGILKPSASITYRSPLSGRETELVFLAEEGTRVGEGDLVARLDASDLERERERAVQDVRQAEVELRTAELERREGQAAIDSLTSGEGALGLEEVRVHTEGAERKVERLRKVNEGLRPLLEQGFITREELDRAEFELQQAESDLALARRKADVYVQRTRPRENDRARLQLAQRDKQLENARARVRETAGRVRLLREQIEGCRIYARAPGLVVYEEYLGSGQRRKIRTGDRVTASQGILTIPQVDRMVVESSVREADVHRVRPAQTATVRLDAYPDLVLRGRVTRVGALARTTADRPFDDKRFDLVIDLDQGSVELRPEMTARIDVLVGERRDVLLVPVSAVFERQGTTVVHRIGRFGVETRPVEAGETDDLWVEIRTGLGEGDRVKLTDDGTPAPVPSSAGGKPAWSRPPAENPIAPR